MFQEFTLQAKRDRVDQDDRDAWDVYDKVSTETYGLPQQNSLALEIATIREWLVNSGAQIRWTADENMIINGPTKDHRESRQHVARLLQEGEWSAQRDATLVREKNLSLNRKVHEGRIQRTSPGKLEDESWIAVNKARSLFFFLRWIGALRVFFCSGASTSDRFFEFFFDSEGSTPCSW